MPLIVNEFPVTVILETSLQYLTYVKITELISSLITILPFPLVIGSSKVITKSEVGFTFVAPSNGEKN